MGWETSDRRSELPRDWAALVVEVKKRAKGRCEWRLTSGARCPRPGRDVDHRKPGNDHSMRNLQLLCPHHHGKKTAREGWQGKARRRIPARPAERHPGAVN